jgi:tetratricopeptide (TPR) repeat protein
VEPDRGRRTSASEDVWVDEGRVDRQPRRGEVQRREGSSRDRTQLPPDVAEELARGGAGQAERDARRLQDGARAYRRERYAETRRLLEPLARNAPGVAAVRELHGLALYRLGRWKAAIKELEAAERLSGSLEHHPVLADCHRALRHHAVVQRLWDELRGADAPAPVVVEGRIVAASGLADQGDVAGAIRLLERGPVEVRKPREHHLRLWYVLATMYEQAGDMARARQLFERVLDTDPDFPDALERYRSLD